ncbi:MAG: DUF58 domain-containing protein [Oscillospiraceae bacterium]|nr:DUF58 domain-containing protein [Oscillospiraceae bacterium]
MILVILLLCILGVLMLSQALIQRFGYKNLTYELSFSEKEVFEGDTVTLTETICSRKPLPLPWVKAELTTQSALLFASKQSTVSEDTRFVSSYFTLLPYRRIERHWNVTCTQRGMYTVSHAVIVLSDLFGAPELSHPMPEAHAELTVLPARRHTSVPEAFPQQLMGDVIRRRMLIPDRIAVSGIRPYADGDPVRDICWSASARTEQPMVRQFQETASPTAAILLNMQTRETDRDTASDRPALENCIRLCAACINAAAQMRIPVRFCANTTVNGAAAETPFRSGNDALYPVLRLLAALPATVSGRCESMIKAVRQQNSNAAIILITVQPTEALIQLADRDPALTVISLKPLRDREIRPNIRHINLIQERMISS